MGEKKIADLSKETVHLKKSWEKSTDDLNKESTNLKKRLEKSASLNKTSYKCLQALINESDQQLAASKHGAEVSALVRKKLEERISMAQASFPISVSLSNAPVHSHGRQGANEVLLQSASKRKQMRISGDAGYMLPLPL